MTSHANEEGADRPRPPAPIPGVDDDREKRLKIAAGRAIAQEYSDRMAHAIPTAADLKLIHRFIFDEVSPVVGEFRESDSVDIDAELQLLERQTNEMLAASRSPADKACAVAFWQARFAALSPFQEGGDRVGAVVLMTQARELLDANRDFPAKLVEQRGTFRVGVANAIRNNNVGPLATTLQVAAGKREEMSFAEIGAPFRVAPLQSESPTMLDERYLGSITGAPYPGRQIGPGTGTHFGDVQQPEIPRNHGRDEI